MPHASNNSYTPSRWPTDLEYLRSTSYAPMIPLDILQYIKGNGPTTLPTTKPHVMIRRIDSAMHPAHGQMGLFASKKIPPGTHIIDYFGEVHTNERPSSDYDLSLYRAYGDGGVIVNVGIDAAGMGNEARFINDYRGIRPKPNALFKERRTEQGELRMSVYSADNEAIKKGDEILVSYGKAWWKARPFDKWEQL